MSPREIESFERVAALRDALGPPGVWICRECSYTAIYATPARTHERQTAHRLTEETRHDA